MRKVMAMVIAMLVSVGTLVGIDAMPAGAQGCTWQNFWTQGGSPGSSWNISYSTCPDGSHQIVGDYHYYGVLRQDMGGFNDWVIWSIGMPGYEAGNNWEGRPAYLYFCANGGGLNRPCYTDAAERSLWNIDGRSYGWAEYYKVNGIQYSQSFGISDEWGHALNNGTTGVHPRMATTKLW